MKRVNDTLEIDQVLKWSHTLVTPIWYKKERNNGKPYYAYITPEKKAVVSFGTWMEILDENEYER